MGAGAGLAEDLALPSLTGLFERQVPQRARQQVGPGVSVVGCAIEQDGGSRAGGAIHSQGLRCLPEAIDLCDELGTLKLLFLVKLPSDSASKFLSPRGTYYVCRVERGAPGAFPGAPCSPQQHSPSPLKP